MTTESLREATKRSQDASERVTEVWIEVKDKYLKDKDLRDKYLKAVQDWDEASREWIEVVNTLNNQEE